MNARPRDPRRRRRRGHSPARCASCSSAPGYAVDEAEDGRAALRNLFATPPALVILDVTMPDMDGYQTLERIRDLSDVPVLMLTARTQELEKVRGLSAGADDYVAKPFGRQELLARVQALLRRTRRQVGGDRGLRRRLRADRLRASGASSSRAATCS